MIKRPDERAVTMDAHDHPAFVEDMARDLSRACRDRGVAHSVSVRNFERVRRFEPGRQAQMRGVLQQIAGTPRLSKETSEVVSKALA